MKKFYEDLAIDWNDYKVEIITDDDYNIIKVIALEEVNESKKHTYKPGDEVKLTKSWKADLKEYLTPFPAEDEDEDEE